MKINLPIQIEVDDYHEFDYLEEYFKKLNRHIKIEEIGFKGYYTGLVYSRKDKSYRKLKKEIKRQIDEYDNWYENQRSC